MRFSVSHLAFVLVALLAAVGCWSKTPKVTQNEATEPSPSVTETEQPAQAEATEPRQSINETPLDSARRSFEAGELDTAMATVQSHLVAEPGDVFGLFLAAQIEATRKQYVEAVRLLDEIPRDHPKAGLAALGQSADWMMAAGKWHEAERRYREVLLAAPSAAVAHRRLSHLLNRQGRSQEAALHVRQLCRAGNITQTELHTLVHVADAVFDDSGDESYAPIGPAAEARILFSKNQFKEALDLLRQPMADDQLQPAGKALFGRLAMEVQDDEAIAIWTQNLDAGQKPLADYWVAIGTGMLQEASNLEGATRAFCEAIVRDPTDWVAMTRLENCMDLLGNLAQRDACRARATLLRKTIQVNHRIIGKEAPDPNDILELAKLLDSLHRPIEATMWRVVAASYAGQTAGVTIQTLDAKRKELVATVPLQMKPAEALAGLDPEKFPIPANPKFQPTDIAGTRSDTGVAAGAVPSLVDVAASVGIDFQYLNAAEPKLRDLQLYQQFGGGCAVLDFDRDGRPDLFFNQGGADPKAKAGGKPNVMFRNLGGNFDRLRHIGIVDNGYGQGVTSGDWNQDGFPDLVIANFFQNTLWINNGDGTFQKAAASELWQQPMWTASIAMADVSGDGLPDIVETNYVDDPAVHQVVPRDANGRLAVFQGPESYRAAEDRIFVNQRDGSMIGMMLRDSGRNRPSHGLGIVVTDIDGVPGNEIFVANDTDANQWWFVHGDENADSIRFRDLAGLRGCGYSARGGSGASMGIATADFDRSGTIDLHVTNFFNEAVHLYLQSDDGIFRDRAVMADLYQPSMPVLGFGTQALDFDNNGAVDLAVVNGHIDDLRFRGSPHKMLPQLFAGLVGRFQLCEVVDPSGYWSRPAIGRGLARLDWNQDGRMDLVATHHDAAAALLENQTETQHRWLQLRLVGTRSERDAIGARVTITAGDQRWVDVVTAGDGYACKNEALLAFGLGGNKADRIDVTWPSGDRQTFQVSDSDKQYLLIEGQTEVFMLPSESNRK